MERGQKGKREKMDVLRTAFVFACLLAWREVSSICMRDQGWCLLHDATLVSERLINSPAVDEDAIVKTKEAGKLSPIIRITNGTSTEKIHPGYYIYREPYYWGNVGHILGDDVFAIFSSLYTWGLHRVNADKVYIVIPDRGGDHRKTAKSKTIIGELYQIITRNSLVFASFDKEERYERLLVGWNDLTYGFNRNVLSIPMMQSFRMRALKTFELHEPVNGTTCRVLFAIKDTNVADHKFSIGNVDELKSAVALNTNCSVSTVCWQGLGMRAQLEFIYMATIVVSLPGSDIMNNIFQPIHSGMIVPDRCDSETGKCEGSNEIRAWYSKTPFRRIQTFEGINNPSLQWINKTLFWHPSHLVHAVSKMWDVIFEDIHKFGRKLMRINANIEKINDASLNILE